MTFTSMFRPTAPLRSQPSSRTSRLARFAKGILGGLAGLAAASSFASTTIDAAINDMTNQNQPPLSTGYASTCPDWCKRANTTQWAPYAYPQDSYAPHLAPYLPSWVTGNRPGYTEQVTPWFVIMAGNANNATNTRVEIRDVRVYAMRNNASRSWQKIQRVARPNWAGNYPAPNNMGSGTSVAQSEIDSGAYTPVAPPRLIHGGTGGTTLSAAGIPYSEDTNPRGGQIRAMFVAMDYRLVVADSSKPDDRASADYYVGVGADYWPTGGASWGIGYGAPGLGNGRMVKADSTWRTATLLVPNWTAMNVAMDGGFNYSPALFTDAVKAELRANPPTEALNSCDWAPGTTCPSGTTTTTTTTSPTTSTTISSTTTTTSATFSVPTTPTHVATVLPGNRCIDVYGGSTENKAIINLFDCTASYQNQQWTFQEVRTGTYRIIAKHSGKCLDVPAYSHDAGVVLQQYDCNTNSSNNQNQLWTFKPVAGTNQFQIASVNTPSMCVDVKAYNGNNGGLIQQYTCNSNSSNNQNQLWTFRP